MSERYRYAAFVSYSSKDAAFAKRLHSALENYGIPTSLGAFDLTGSGRKKNRIYPIFRDREELAAGHLGDAIEANLRASAALIVVCSPDASASPWVQKEIEYFVGLGRADKIFAIVAENAPFVDQNGADATPLCFPPAFRGDALKGDKLEPLAADARKGKDGFRNAWLKLVAGLIGVSPGQIVDRDRRARRRRVAGLIAVTALPVIAIIAVWQNWAAIHQEYVRVSRYSSHTLGDPSTVAPGQSFLECDSEQACPRMVVLPSGAFLMGSGDKESGALPNELQSVPPGQQAQPFAVSVARFAVSKFEITRAQWQACAMSGGCAGQQTLVNVGGTNPRIPAMGISWVEAQQYVRWLSHMTGGRYRLLSEAEWEYSARGVTSAAPDHHTRFAWGDAEPTCTRQAASAAAFSGCWKDDPSLHGPFIVGSFGANAFGLNDMHGNVFEWVQDCYRDHYDSSTGAAAFDPAGCEEGVTRGGSWEYGAQYMRSAFRGSAPRAGRIHGTGFRVARGL